MAAVNRTVLRNRERLAPGLAVGVYGVVRTLLAAVFFYAGARKLADPEAFGVVIDAFGLVPAGWIWPLAVSLPALEVLFALGLAADIRGSLAGIAALLALFLAILAYGIRLGLDIDCGCFGPEDPESRAFGGMRAAFHRDVVLAAAVFLIYGWRRWQGIETRRLSSLLRRAGRPDPARRRQPGLFGKERRSRSTGSDA